VASASKPSKPASASGAETRPTAQELDQTLASLTDDDEDEASFADLNDTAEPDAPLARSQAKSSSSAKAAPASPPPSTPPKDPPKEPGVPTEMPSASARTVKIELNPSRARMTVEAVDDDEWPDE
jgi:hypothetical protein